MAGVCRVWACMVVQMCLWGVLGATPPSHYRTLGVDRAATDSQIKKSFRNLAAKYHPDKSKRADAESRFREVAEAYHVLSNQKKRSLYDSVGHEAFLNNKASVDPKGGYPDDLHFRFEDLFHHMDVESYVEESYFHWSSQHAGEDAGAEFQHDGIEDPFYSTYLGGLVLYYSRKNVHFDLEDILCKLSKETINAPKQHKTGSLELHAIVSFKKQVKRRFKATGKADKRHTGFNRSLKMMEEIKEEGSLTVRAHSVKVTEVLKDGDVLTFLIVSEKLTGTGEYHVHRTYEDFEWLQQHLFSQEEVPGIQGVIFPPLPAKAQVNTSAKVLKQLGFLGLGEWQLYCRALETFLRQVATHSTLGKNKDVEIFLTSSDPPGRQRAKKNIFNRLSQAVEEMRKEGHKDMDEFFQAEREHNHLLAGCSKAAAERFLDVVQTEQRIAVASGHFAAALQLCVEAAEDSDKQAFSDACVKLSQVFDCMKKNMAVVAENNASTLGLALDLDTRYQEAEKEMLFRRTCKLVELEAARKNVDKAKPVKKAAMEEVWKSAQADFENISRVAKKEITQLQGARVELLQRALVQLCEKQLCTAKEYADQFNQQLQAFRGMA